MRFKTFLLSEEQSTTRTKPISKEQAFAAIKTHCSQYINGRLARVIYRGVSSYNANDPEFAFVDPSVGRRRSANTKNYYTLFIDNDKSWSAYPKRSESIICSTDYFTAADFGTAYAVFPYDGAKFGICPEADFWASFKLIWKLVYNGQKASMDDFNHVIQTLYTKFTGAKSLGDNSWTHLERSYNKLGDLIYSEWKKNPKEFKNEWFSKNPFHTEYYNLTKLILGHNGNVVETIRMLMDPERNHFSCVPAENVMGNDKEVWTDSKCILVDLPSYYDKDFMESNHTHLFREFLQELKG